MHNPPKKLTAVRFPEQSGKSLRRSKIVDGTYRFFWPPRSQVSGTAGAPHFWYEVGKRIRIPNCVRSIRETPFSINDVLAPDPGDVDAAAAQVAINLDDPDENLFVTPALRYSTDPLSLIASVDTFDEEEFLTLPIFFLLFVNTQYTPSGSTLSFSQSSGFATRIAAIVDLFPKFHIRCYLTVYPDRSNIPVFPPFLSPFWDRRTAEFVAHYGGTLPGILGSNYTYAGEMDQGDASSFVGDMTSAITAFYSEDED